MENFREKYEGVLVLIKDVYEELEVLNNSNGFSRDELIIFLILRRIYNHYFTVSMLIEHQLYLDAKIIIRAVIEATIVFNALIDKPKDTIEMLDNLSLFNKYKLWEMAMTHSVLKENAQKHDFTNCKGKNANIKQFALLSESNNDLYKIAYPIISSSVHINMFSIEDLLDTTDEPKLRIKDQIDVKSFELSYWQLFDCLLVIATKLNDKYKLELNAKLEIIEEKLNNFTFD